MFFVGVDICHRYNVPFDQSFLTGTSFKTSHGNNQVFCKISYKSLKIDYLQTNAERVTWNNVKTYRGK